MKHIEDWKQQLRKQEELYQEMLEVSKRQRDFIENCEAETKEKDMAVFQQWIDKRYRLMDAIEGIDQLKEEICQHHPQGELMWQAHKDKCAAFIRQIQGNDAITNISLKKAYDQSAAGLANVRGTKKVNKAYLQIQDQQPWFFDKKK